MEWQLLTAAFGRTASLCLFGTLAAPFASEREADTAQNVMKVVLALH